jgi:hypothetical protein
MAITLGKDCTVSIGGTIASARSVTLETNVETIQINEFGSRENAVYPIRYDRTVTVEFNDSSDLGAANSYITSGASFQVTGGAGSWGFTAVLTGVSESDPIDGVATFTITGKLTREGLR